MVIGPSGVANQSANASAAATVTPAAGVKNGTRSTQARRPVAARGRERSMPRLGEARAHGHVEAIDTLLKQCAAALFECPLPRFYSVFTHYQTSPNCSRNVCTARE